MPLQICLQNLVTEFFVLHKAALLASYFEDRLSAVVSTDPPNTSFLSPKKGTQSILLLPSTYPSYFLPSKVYTISKTVCPCQHSENKCSTPRKISQGIPNWWIRTYLTVNVPWLTFSPGVGCQSLLVEIPYVSEISPPNKSSQILHGVSVLKPRYYIQIRSPLSYIDLQKLKISSL